MTGLSAYTAPMSYTQEQLWIAEQLHPGRGIYTESVAMRLTGPVDLGSLDAALGRVIARHEILRTVFPLVDDRPVQQVLPAVTLPLQVVDLGELPEPAREPAFGELARQFVEQPVDLVAGPLFRCLLASAGEEDHILVLALHHLVCDGWSARLVVEELEAQYAAVRAGTAGPVTAGEIQFADYAVWERQVIGDGLLDPDRDRWLQVLAGVPATLELWPARDRPATKGVSGRRAEYTLDGSLGPVLSRLCRRRGASAFVAAMAVYAAVASRWSGQDDFVVGTLVANRIRSELEPVVGQFANTVPVRLNTSGDPTFDQLLVRARDRMLDAIDRGGTPLEWIVAAYQPDRSPDHNALIQHLFLAKEAPVRIETLGPAKVAPFEVTRRRGRLDTIVEADFGPDHARVWIEYDTALFTAEVIDRFVADLGQALAAWAARPQLRLSELPIGGPPAADEPVAAVQPAPVPVRPGPARTGTDPGPLDLVLMQMWAELLSRDTVEPGDDFFELGGHSMLASRLVQRLRDMFDMQVPLRLLFESPALGEFARRLRELNPGLEESLGRLLAGTASADQDESDEEVSPAPAEPVADLSGAQVQLWLAEQTRPGQLTHTIPLVLSVTGRMSPEALVRALNAVVARHDGLRVTFGEQDGRPVQRFSPHLEVGLPLIDLSGLPADDRDRQAATLRERFGSTAFDLATGPLLTGRIVRLSEQRHEVQLAFHHLITDEVSMGVFARELSECYRAELAGRPPDLPPLPVRLADYVAWERDLLAGPEATRLVSFWRRELGGAPAMRVPTDHPRPPELTFDGTFLDTAGDISTFRSLAELARRLRTTSFVVYATAVATLLHRYTGGTDLVIGVPSENRMMPGSEQLIGCFLNVLPLRVDVSGDPRLTELTQRVHDALITAYDHQSLPLARIVEAVQPVREKNRLPLVQVACELQLDGWLPFDFPDASVRYAFVPHGTARYEMAFHAMVKPDEVFLGLELNTNLWHTDTGYRLLGDLDAILRRFVADPDLRLSDLTTGG